MKHCLFLVLFCLYPFLVFGEEEFNLGALLCLSGNCSEWGNNSLKGIQLAINEINAEGGVLGRKISLQYTDTDESISGAVGLKEFLKFIRRDIHYIIGPSWMPAGLSIAPVAKNMKDSLILISPSLAGHTFSETSDNLFKTSTDDSIFVRKIAHYCFEQGLKKAAIYSSQQPAELEAGRVFEEEFQRLGGIITSREEPLPTLTELNSVTFKIIHSNPDVIFLSNYNQMSTANKELRNLGYTGNKATILLSREKIKESERELEGTVFASYPKPSAKFLENYKNTYLEDPGITADIAYDTVWALKKAIEITKSFDPKIVKKTLAEITYQGVASRFIFDKNRSSVREAVLYKVKGDDFIPLP